MRAWGRFRAKLPFGKRFARREIQAPDRGRPDAAAGLHGRQDFAVGRQNAGVSELADLFADLAGVDVEQAEHAVLVEEKGFAIRREGEEAPAGVAGAILWKLVAEFLDNGRCEFTNRELRLATELNLSGVQDNLEVRLVLLQRRLAEHRSAIQIDKTGRGRFRLTVSRPIELEEVRQPIRPGS